MKNTRSIYFLCPDSNEPAGGIKVLYRHVDILNRSGFSAFILHSKKGFRCTWFKNDTKIAYKSVGDQYTKSTSLVLEIKKFILSPALNPFYATMCLAKFIINWEDYRVKRINGFKTALCGLVTCNKYKDAHIGPSDILVVPEVYGPDIANIEKGTKKVIINQNVHYTFTGYTLGKDDMRTPYLDKDTIAVVVISEHNLNCLRYIFPKLNIARLYYGIDPAIFKYNPHKKQQIAFMIRKLPKHAQAVINSLKFRGALDGFELCVIDNNTEAETTRILQDSLIFLSFSTHEGCPLPPMEAMACGCIVIGYHGSGGKEYFDKDVCYPVDAEDIMQYAKTVEMALEEYKHDKNKFLEKGRKASGLIRKTYSMDREEASVVGFWKEILSKY